MGLRRRTLVTVGATLLTAVATTLAVGGWSLWQAGVDSERKGMQESATAGVNLLESLARTLAGATREYASWDNTWNYLHGGARDYTHVDLTVDSFANLDADVVLIGRGDQPVYAAYKDPDHEAAELVAVPPLLHATLVGALAGPSPGIGLVEVSGAPWLYAVEPVTLSDGSRGDGQAMLIARRLANSRLLSIAQVLRGDFELTPANEPLPLLDDDCVTAFAPIDEIGGRGPWTLHLTRSSERLQEFRHQFGLLSTNVALVGFVALTTILFVIDRLVLVRLASFSVRTARIRREAPESRLPVSGFDEFDKLAREVNGLLDEVAVTNARLQHEALHDPLTGLPNRTLLVDRVKMALARSNRSAEGTAVLFVDLDRMKLVNDQLGHTVGDTFIRHIAARLLSSVRPSDTVARLGGDEFAILLVNVSSPAVAADRARHILGAIRMPVVHGDQEYLLTASIGITLSRRGAEPGALLREADVAMYAAKAAGRDQWALYDSVMHGQVLERLAIERALRRALADGAVEAWFQPILCLSSGRLIGFETLARWTDPQFGPVPPSRFIPIAEETHLIDELDRYILDRALAAVARWSITQPGLYVAVNQSAKRFDAPDLVDYIATTLAAKELGGECLVIEITETLFGKSEGRWSVPFGQLSELGVRIALDDFGTGYSSLSRLRSASVSVLKLDQTFVADLATGNGAVARAIVRLADELGMTVVAEGVESADVAALLHEIGCPSAQGWLYAPALTEEQATRWVTPSSGDPL